MLHRLNKTRGAKEGVIEPSAADLIRPFVAGPSTPPRYALHFGTVDKVGVNPKSEYNTPLAVCAYPLTEEIFDQFLRIDLPFAQKDAKYLFVLEIKPDARVFYSTERFFDLGVGPEYLGADLSKIEVSGDPYEVTMADIREASFSKQFFYSTAPSGYYRKKQYLVEGGTAARAAQWGRKLWKMGIDVWVDADREGILHRAEPSQVMFFNPSSYRVVLSMDNPKNTLQVRFGRDWRKRKDIDVSPADRARGGDKDLIGANLIGANLIGANLIGANLTGAYLTGAYLTGAYLRDVRYDNSTTWPDYIQDVLRVWQGDKNLRGADLTGANLTSADLTGADLTRADLTGANLTSAYLEGADLTRADLTGANLSSANLTGADLPGAVLRYANLTGADLPGADITGADLTGADLTGADLSNAILNDIIYDYSTRWPARFTPPPSAIQPFQSFSPY